MGAKFDFKGFNNVVIENYIESYLNTKLGMSRFLTVDNSLIGRDGLQADIHTYKGTGSAQAMERGDGQTQWIDSEYEVKTYVAKRTQSGTRFYDDDKFTDSKWIESKIQFCGESMVNDFNNAAIREMYKTENIMECDSFNFDAFCDAVAKYANVHESEEGLMFLADIALAPALRKTLNTNLLQTEGYIRTGALGSILGIPVYVSKIVPAGHIFLVDKAGIRDFVKSNVRVENERDASTKENCMYIDRYDIIALYDETRVIAFGKGQSTAATITTAAAAGTTVAGAATTGAKVTVYVNGVIAGTPATAASSAYSITVPALAAGDKVKVVAELAGHVKSIAKVTVSA